MTANESDSAASSEAVLVVCENCLGRGYIEPWWNVYFTCTWCEGEGTLENGH